MSNIPKNPIIGQASEFEKHLRKQEELVRDSKNKGPTRYYANRKPEWAENGNEYEEDENGSDIFVQQGDEQQERPKEGFSVTITSSAPAHRERPRRREKVAATVVSVNEDVNGMNDPRLRRLLRNEKQRMEKEESQSSQPLGESAPTSRVSRRQRIRAEIIQHQKELEDQEHEPIKNQDITHVQTESSSTDTNLERLEKKEVDGKDIKVAHSRKELREAIRMRELVKTEPEKNKTTDDFNSAVPEIENAKKAERKIAIKEEEISEKESEEEEEEEEDDDDDDEWPEMVAPSFVPKDQRVLPKIEECLEREEEYFKQSEVDRVNK